MQLSGVAKFGRLIRGRYLNGEVFRSVGTSSIKWAESGGKDAGTPSEEGESVMKEPSVKIEKDEQYHVMSIGLNRPHKRNCVNHETSIALLDAFHDFESDDKMHTAILYGVGGNFCAGYDLEELSDLDEGSLPDKIAQLAMGKGPLGPTRMERTKPVIAAIDGFAVASGMELALMCDIRIVEDSALMGFLNRRFGVPLIDGGTIRLPELIGLSRALDLIITGRVISAKEAFEFGLANRLVKNGTAYGRAFHTAQEISKHPQECLRADRSSAIYATFSSTSLEDSFHYENEHGIPVILKESIDGAKKFVKGLGKHGKFNVSPAVELEDWQKEFNKIKQKNGETPRDGEKSA